MAKQKRKESQVAEKKSKKLRKVSAVETPAACAAPPGPGTAPAEVGAAGTARWPRLSPDLGGHSVVVWLVSGWTVPSRHARCRCSRGPVTAAGACRAEPRSRAVFRLQTLGCWGCMQLGLEALAQGRGPGPGVCVYLEATSKRVLNPLRNVSFLKLLLLPPGSECNFSLCRADSDPVRC